MIGVFRFSVVIEGALEAAEGFDWDSGQVVVEMGTPHGPANDQVVPSTARGQTLL